MKNYTSLTGVFLITICLDYQTNIGSLNTWHASTALRVKRRKKDVNCSFPSFARAGSKSNLESEHCIEQFCTNNMVKCEANNYKHNTLDSSFSDYTVIFSSFVPKGLMEYEVLKMAFRRQSCSCLILRPFEFDAPGNTRLNPVHDHLQVHSVVCQCSNNLVQSVYRSEGKLRQQNTYIDQKQVNEFIHLFVFKVSVLLLCTII